MVVYVGVRVLNVETVTTRVGRSQERRLGYEAMYTHNSGDTAERWENIVWLYIDGEYSEPPSSLVPTPPPHRQEEDCNIL